MNRGDQRAQHFAVLGAQGEQIRSATMLHHGNPLGDDN
jgi:hypothetical protein